MNRCELALKLTSSALGLGYLPVAPGTWGSAGAAGLYWLLRVEFGPAGVAVTGGLLVGALLLGLWLCPGAVRVFGDSDPGRFVLDELAGCWLTCLLFWGHGALLTAGAAFAAFRVFDVLKPFPIRALERLPGGWGVMADDLGAALYAGGALWIIRFAIGRLVL
jgi:phosphatidylglycerophosphatase A